MRRLNIKKELLKNQLKLFDSLTIAFSGGVDSTFLLAMAYDILKEKVIAVTSNSFLHLDEEEAAITIAKKLNVKHIIINSNELAMANFCANTSKRCYICKNNLFQQMKKLTPNSILAHGANIDDLNDFRPGFQAAYEMDVVAPLIDSKLTKIEIRKLSKEMGLETWNKLSTPCLATRIPYGTPITKNILMKIAQAEKILKTAGFKECRVRYHNNIARIEINPLNFHNIIDADIRVDIIQKIKNIGFLYVTLDLDGYLQGSMNYEL